MPDTLIGTCPGCGAESAPLQVTTFKALLERGTTRPICASCEERTLVKLGVEIDRDPELRKAERAELKTRLRDRVTATPAPASAPAPAPASQPATNAATTPAEK